MTKITVLSKQTQTVLIEDDVKQVFLNQPSIVQLNINKDDILSTSRNGHDAVILLKNGEQIVLTNFFLVKDNLENTLVLPQKDGRFTFVDIDDQGVITDYRGNLDLETLLTSTHDALSMPAKSQVAEDSFSLADFLETNGAKVGLAVALGFGLVPLLDDGKDENKSPPTPDVDKPDAPKAELTDNGNKVKGQAEANAKVILLDSSKNIIASVNADKNGQYEIEIPKNLQTGATLTLVAQDAANNISTETSLVTKDNLAPDRPLAQMNDEGNNISGKAESNATVEVLDESGKVLYSVKANVNGEYSFNIQPPLASGKILKVIAKDAAGNSSDAVEVSPGKDSTPPTAPKNVTVQNDGTLLTGLTEPKAKVTLKNEKNEIIGTAEANDKGEFSLKISPALTEQSKAQIYIQDTAGNESLPHTITLSTDTLAPDAPTANIRADGLEITGKAEIGVTIYVKSLDNKTTLGTAKVEQDGTYKITLTQPITDKTKVNVIAVDQANNESEAFILEGIDKDTIAPSAPSITDLTDDIGEFKGSIKNNGLTDDVKPIINGRGEAGATITLYNHDKVMAYIEVSSNGTWTYTPPNDLALGQYSLVAMQTDKAGNTSVKSSVFNFTLEAEKVTTLSSILEDTQEANVEGMMNNTETAFELQTNLARVLVSDELDRVSIDQEYDDTYQVSTSDLFQQQSQETIENLNVSNLLGVDGSSNATIENSRSNNQLPQLSAEESNKIYDELFGTPQYVI